MDLLGLTSGPAPRSAGGDGRAPAPGPEGGAFGEVVASAKPQPMAQGGAGDAGAGSGDQPGPRPGQPPTPMFEAADSPATGLSAGVHPSSQAGQIVATVPDAGSNMPPGASADSISDHDDAFGRPETRAPAAALAGAGTPALPGAEPRATAFVPPTPAAGGQPANPAGSSARATPGIEFTAIPGSPGAPASPAPPGLIALGANADAANPLPRAAGEAAAPDPGTATARSAGANAAVQVAPHVAVAAAGDQARAPGTASPDPLPGTGPQPVEDLPGRIRAGGRGAQPAPSALPIWASSPPPGGPPVEPGPAPMPALPGLPSAAMKGGGPVVRDAVMQALGDSGPIGFAASSAATAQSPAGPAPAAAPPGVAGGAETARAVAPQIAAAIGSGPGSGRIEIRLDPPELGRVEILLEITDQSLRATLAAERPATNELLRRHSEILLAQLQQAGFTGIDLQFAEKRAGDQGGAQPGATPPPASAEDPDAPPDGDNADRPAGRVARRATDGLDLRL